MIAELADWLTDGPGLVRVAVDGPPCAAPGELAADLIERLHALGRPAVHVRSELFWRDASLRFEHGREDVASYANWLDGPALRREVLDAGGSYLPSLRDPQTNRSTHAAPLPLAPDTVLIVSGTLLLGAALPFDRTVHLAVPREARARLTAADHAWTLPAHDAYDARVAPSDLADVVIRPDRRTPVVRGLPN